MKTISLILGILSFCNISVAGPSSPRIIGSAQAIVAASGNGSSTDCSVFVRKVLNRAGYSVGGFTANGFSDVMARQLSSWKSKVFSVHSSGRSALRAFLNAAPDRTAFLAQWPRSGRSGHVAIIVKEGLNRYRIYQAQQGLRRPHSKIASIESLLYAPNEYGDRARLRIYFE